MRPFQQKTACRHSQPRRAVPCGGLSGQLTAATRDGATRTIEGVGVSGTRYAPYAGSFILVYSGLGGKVRLSYGHGNSFKYMILTTERLLLREFEDDDWRAVLEYQSKPLFLRYNPWWYRTENDVRSFVRMFIDWSREVPRKKFQFAIILRDEGLLIGNCGLRMQTPHARVGEIGYELDDRYWGHGYATEAACSLLDLGFTRLHLHRIWAYCVAQNSASARVLTRIGMTYEGCQRESEWMKNCWWDTLHYAILDHEWQGQSRQ